MSGLRSSLRPFGLNAADEGVFRDCRVKVDELDRLIAAGGPPAEWIRSVGARPSSQFDYSNPPPARSQMIRAVDNPSVPGTQMWPRDACARCCYGLRPPTHGQADQHADQPYRYAHPAADGSHPESICNALKCDLWLAPYREIRRLLAKPDGSRPRDFDNATLGIVPPPPGPPPAGLRP